MPQTKHILVIEDNHETADLVKRLIKKCIPAAKVRVVYEEEAALTYIRSSEPNPTLIFLDLCLPTQDDGYQLLASFKAHFKIYRESPPPILILTNSDENIDIKSCYQLGASSYLVKPETYQGWLSLCNLIKIYWLDTVTLPSRSYQ